MGFKDKRFVKPSKDVQETPTKHLYMAGLGQQMGTNRELLRKFLVDKFGPLEESQRDDGDDDDGVNDDGLYMPHDRRYCVASFQSVEHAVVANDFFHTDPDLSFVGASKVSVRFANLAEDRIKTIPEPICTSTTSSIEVPGLYLLEDFISEEEENQLMEQIGCDSSPSWKESLNRRVQVLFHHSC
jgi:hypothetical protein